jgi:hypothetical protein
MAQNDEMQLTGFKVQRPFRHDASWCLPAACQNASRDALAAKMQDALIGFGLEVMSALVGTPNLTSGPK